MMGRNKLDPACIEARVADPDGPLARERIHIHRARCEACGAQAEAIEELHGALDLLDRGLDDLARARIEQKLAPVFDRLATERGTTRHSVSRLGLSFAALIGAAMLMTVLLHWQPDLEVRSPIQPRLIAGFEACPRLSLLAPWNGDPSRGESENVGRRERPPHCENAKTSIEVPADGRFEAEIGEDAWILVEGPASVEALPAPMGTTTLRQQGGLLIADVRKRADQRWKVLCGDFVVEIVGTRFAIDARRANQIACLAAFHARFPSSTHDLEALRVLSALTEQREGCRGARRWLEELATLYPEDPAAAAARERLVLCDE